MSTRLAWRVAVRDSNLDPTAKHVALTLDTYMNSRGLAWPSRATLAEATGLSVRTVERALKRVSQSGLIIVIRGRGRTSNLYRANLRSSDTDVATNGPVVASQTTVVASQTTRSSDTHVARSRKKPYEAEERARTRTPEPRASAGAYRQHEGAPHKVTYDPAMAALARGWLQ
jgi:DNA-binding transcriptional MocR family regulator